MVIENNMMLRIFFLITWGLLEAMASLNTSDENVKLINILEILGPTLQNSELNPCV